MANNYNFYIVFGSVPTMYAQINVFLDNTPSYIWYYRDNFFDINSKYCPKNLKLYYQTKGFDTEFLKDTCDNIKLNIEEIKKNDKKAKFNIFIDDSRVQFYLKPFILSNSIKDINNIILLSEGNISQYMYNDIKKDDKDYQKSRWENLINGIKNGNNDNDLLKIENYCFWLSTQKNVEYLIPFINLLYNKNVSAEYKNEMNLKNLNIEEMYSKLSDKYKKCIFGDIKIVSNLNNNYIIIIGTYDFGTKHLTSIIYENLINQVLRDYGEDYTFIFKAHPLFPVSDNKYLEDYLKNHNIAIMPEKTPLEPLLWDNKNLLIGGFCSSVNSMINPLRTKFFFGEKIGFSELLDKNKKFHSKVYDIELSQKLASGMLSIYYENVAIKQQLEDEITLLQQREKLLSNRLTEIEQKYIKGDENTKNFNIINKFINRIRNLKHKILGVKGSK